MGQEFAKNGMFISYTDLTDFSSIKTLQASLHLPVPKGLRYNISNNKGLDVTNHFGSILNSLNEYEAAIASNNTSNEEFYKVEYLQKVALLLNEVYNFYDEELFEASLKVTGLSEDQIKRVTDLLDIHEGTIVPEEIQEKAYRNFISTSIQRVVSDIRNTPLAHSPISMDDLHPLAAKSAKGEDVVNMSLYNPSTKYLMQVQNVVGKNVIGISAVGEKVFFNLQYYYNEVLRKGDGNKRRYAFFKKTFKRIQGRTSGNITEVTKNRVANINFDNFEDLRVALNNASELDASLRQRYGITDDDIQNKTLKYYEYLDDLKLELSESPIDLMISQILSASTDNAKELILAKINAGDNLAKCHLYLLTLGFDISDVVTFMASPAINVINDLSEANVFNSYLPKISVKQATQFAQGLIDPGLFAKGEKQKMGEEGNKVTIKNSDILIQGIKSLVNSRLDPNKKYTNAEYVQAYIKMRLEDPNMQPVPLSFSEDIRGEGSEFSVMVETVISKLRKASQEVKVDELFLDLNEFKNILENADEMSTLGSTFLGLNQGLSTSKVDLQNDLRKIRQAVTNRERALELHKLKTNKDNPSLLNLIISTISEYHKGQSSEFSHYSEDEIISVVTLAHAAGISMNFDPEMWLNDRQITEADLKYKENKDAVLLGESESISYRQLTKDYYNLIKGTYNIFDVVESVPQYRAILNLFKSVYNMEQAISVKGRILNQINKEFLHEFDYLDDRQRKILSGYVDKLLVHSFFSRRNYKFPIAEGTEFLDTLYKNVISEGLDIANLRIPSGRASLKKVFETVVLTLQKTGSYGEYTLENYNENILLQDFQLIFDRKGTPQLTVALNMMQTDQTPAARYKLQQYIDSMKELEQFKIGDYTFMEWLQLYNLYVNQNQYGSDRLTSLFKYTDTSKILDDYYHHLSTLDYSSQSLNLEDIGFSIDDALIAVAPTVSESAEKYATAPYIRVPNKNGGVDIKKRQRFYYETISVFPKDLTVNKDINGVNEQEVNYQMYQILPMINFDNSKAIENVLINANLEDFQKIFDSYMKTGSLKVFKTC